MRTLSGISRTVFISYASQDTEAASLICEALRATGIEVWFDRSELRGGDAWDQSIRKQIKTCDLFLPVISRNTHDRDEGYFRLEWKLAVDRCHLMAADKAFLLPVVIDDTRDDDERVPERFRDVQWTRLPGGVSPAAFVERVRRLLAGDLTHEPAAPASGAARSPVAPTTPKPGLASWRSKAAFLATIAVVVVALGYVANRLVILKPGAEVGGAPGSVAQSAPATAFNPPPHSIAVLPLTNLSGDAQQEYFSDGMTEELINAVSQVSALKVIARTSSFSFKGKNVDIGTIARALNVSAILEGSIRRSGTTVRITVQLINALNGFHIWSQNYDRDLQNVLAMQSEIAAIVAQQLQVKLLKDEPAKIEAGGTTVPQAFDAYLIGKHFRPSDRAKAIANLEEAVRLDPRFARAWALLARMYDWQAEEETPAQAAVWRARARAAAENALRLDPQLTDSHAALARLYGSSLDWVAAEREVQAAEAIDARSISTLNARGNLEFQLGHWQQAIREVRLALELDPLNVQNLNVLAASLSADGQHREAAQVYRRVLELEPLADSAHTLVAIEMLLDGRPGEAISEANLEPSEENRDFVLVMAHYALGRRAESDLLLASFDKKYASSTGHAGDMAYIHGFRGETGLAFQWIDRAVAQHEPALYVIKGNFGALPNIKGDPRYAAILHKLGLPE
jgi:TolB-like protein/Tfp pilus assembly protein PilF